MNESQQLQNHNFSAHTEQLGSFNLRNLKAHLAVKEPSHALLTKPFLKKSYLDSAMDKCIREVLPQSGGELSVRDSDVRLTTVIDKIPSLQKTVK